MFIHFVVIALDLLANQSFISDEYRLVGKLVSSLNDVKKNLVLIEYRLVGKEYRFIKM
jgi:hypothetical protein